MKKGIKKANPLERTNKSKHILKQKQNNVYVYVETGLMLPAQLLWLNTDCIIKQLLFLFFVSHNAIHQNIVTPLVRSIDFGEWFKCCMLVPLCVIILHYFDLKPKQSCPIPNPTKPSLITVLISLHFMLKAIWFTETHTLFSSFYFHKHMCD